MSTRPVRIPDRVLAWFPHAAVPPAEHTAAELERLTTLIRASGARHVAIGHGQNYTSVAAAAAFNAAWTELGRVVAQIVGWPADAASWLRHARRLVAGDPPAWVIADTPAGWAQMAARLTEEPGWFPARTFGFAALGNPVLIDLTGDTLAGMSGATADGARWAAVDNAVAAGERTGVYWSGCCAGTCNNHAAWFVPSRNAWKPRYTPSDHGRFLFRSSAMCRIVLAGMRLSGANAAASASGRTAPTTGS